MSRILLQASAVPAALWDGLVILQAVLLFIGGGSGAFARAVCSATQETLSRRTLADVIMGGFMGVLLPVLPMDRLFGIKLNGELTAFQLMALAGVVAFIGNWTTTLIGWRLGAWKRTGQR